MAGIIASDHTKKPLNLMAMVNLQEQLKYMIKNNTTLYEPDKQLGTILTRPWIFSRTIFFMYQNKCLTQLPNVQAPVEMVLIST